MKVVQYNIPQYQEIGGKNEEIIRMFKGLNSYDPLSIPSNFFTELENLDFDDYPTLTTRKGLELVLSSGSPVIGFGVWKGRELHVINDNGTWRAFNGSTWKTVKTGMNTNGVYSFTNLIVCTPSVVAILTRYTPVAKLLTSSVRSALSSETLIAGSDTSIRPSTE